MAAQNPILEDYKMLSIFKNIGHQLLQSLRGAMAGPAGHGLFKNIVLGDPAELQFTYLEHSFRTGVEVYFNHTRLPRTANLTTYYTPAGAAREEIIAYPFDISLAVANLYTADDFAPHYLIEFHQNLKKTFSDNHTPFAIRFGK